MSGVVMAGLLIEASAPERVARFWAAALDGEATMLLDGSVVVRGDFPELTFYPEARPKTVKNRVHFDVYVRSVESLLALGATVLDEYLPMRATLADIDGNEFCAFLSPEAPASGAARVFGVCTDSDRPEELAAWWAARVGARIDDVADGAPRWLYGSSGWPELIWKFVRVDDERVTPNRWRWTVAPSDGVVDRLQEAGASVAEAGVLLDPQGNQFSVQ